MKVLRLSMFRWKCTVIFLNTTVHACLKAHIKLSIGHNTQGNYKETMIIAN